MAMATGTAALIPAGIGTGISAVSQWRAGGAEAEAGQAQQRAAESQAALADYNAAIADLQAKDAVERGAIEAGKFRARTRGLIGEQVAGFAAGNIDVGFGSAVDVQAGAAFAGELDALPGRTDASREAWGCQVEGEGHRQR